MEDVVERELEFNGLCYSGIFPAHAKPEETLSLRSWMLLAIDVYVFCPCGACMGKARKGGRGDFLEWCAVCPVCKKSHTLKVY